MRLPKPMVIFVVGHERWGKSFTLSALKQICGSRKKEWYITVKSIQFRVRTTSNDDFPERYSKFILSFSGDYLIAALCPKFLKLKNYSRRTKTIERSLQSLQSRRYKLAFWVIKHRWRDPAQFISQEEISELRKYGTVEVFKGIRVRDRQRADVFRRFILRHLT